MAITALISREQERKEEGKREADRDQLRKKVS